jgi:hypothetical protein
MKGSYLSIYLSILLFSSSPLKYSTHISHTNGRNYLPFFNLIQTISRKNILFLFRFAVFVFKLNFTLVFALWSRNRENIPILAGFC